MRKHKLLEDESQAFKRAIARLAIFKTSLMHKFTTELINDYDKIVIENLSVKGMLMSHVASKGVHRSMFGNLSRS